MQKRIAAVQDLSCFGKCSLAVVLPVISAMGVECAVLPTTVLSGHFAALPQVSVLDLTAQMEIIMEQWQGLEFDGIFSGYLGSAAQAEVVGRFVERFRQENTVFVADPAMGDRGRLYRGFDEVHVRAMTKLCSMADVTLPNVTEACLMLGLPYREVHDRAFVSELTAGMLELGAKAVVLTGVCLSGDRVGIACSRGGAPVVLDQARVPGHYNGTGDLFGAVLSAGLVRGDDLPSCAERAMNFTAEVIRRTAENPDHRPYGVDFEQCLHLLTESVYY